MRELGFGSRWLGARTPVSELVRACEDETTAVIAISASGISTDGEKLKAYLEELKMAAEENKVMVVVGGHGAWPEELPVGERVITFSELPAVVRRLSYKLN